VLLNLPNLLSLSRIVMAPILYFLLLSEVPLLIKLGCFVFLIGALTDYFDGWTARRFRLVSDWGRFVDPLADKVLTLFALLAFVQLGIIPFWMFAIIAFRDISTTLLRVYSSSIHFEMKTSSSAKLKTFLQMLFITFILLLLFLLNTSIFVSFVETINLIIFSKFTYFSMLILTIITILTMFEYIFGIIFRKS